MDAFASSLKTSLQKAMGVRSFTGDVNPLAVIGLSESLLALNLTEDQMYIVVHRYARQVLQQIHPDTQGGKQSKLTDENQRRIFEAFDTLDDRANFSRALAEFRTLRSDERTEANLLRRSLVVVKDRLAAFESRELALSQGSKTLERDREIIDIERRNHRQDILDLNREAGLLRGTIRSLEISRAHWRASSRSLTEVAVGFDSYFSRLGLRNSAAKKVGIHTFDAKWVAFASLVPGKYARNIEDPFDSQKKPTLALATFLDDLGVDENSLRRLVASWFNVMKVANIPDLHGFRSTAILKLTILLLLNGEFKFLYGWDEAVMRGRLIGSLPTDRVPIDRVRLTHLVERHKVFSNISPLLQSGRALVFGRMEKITDKKGQLVPIARFDTRHIAVGVG